MPPATMGLWIEQYIASDFLQSKRFQQSLKSLHLPMDLDGRPSNETMDLDNPSRKRTDRIIFTRGEMAITRDVCSNVPQLVITVLAFQSAFQEYLDQMQSAIAASKTLSKPDKERGKAIVDKLTQLWGPSNFIQPSCLRLRFRINATMKGAWANNPRKKTLPTV